MRLLHPKYEIILDNDRSYRFDAADNARKYERTYRLDDEPYVPSSVHGVRVFDLERGEEIASCVLGAAGGASGIHEHSAIVHDETLVVAVGPFVASLDLPTLAINWKTQADDATCFGVYHSVANQCYLSHGELQIARLSYAGQIDWSRGGADIFTNGFTVSDDHVTAVDWNGDVYAWDIRTGKAW